MRYAQEGDGLVVFATREDMPLPEGVRAIGITVWQMDKWLIAGNEFRTHFESPLMARDLDDIYLDQAYNLCVKYIGQMNQILASKRGHA